MRQVVLALGGIAAFGLIVAAVEVSPRACGSFGEAQSQFTGPALALLIVSWLIVFATAAVGFLPPRAERESWDFRESLWKAAGVTVLVVIVSAFILGSYAGSCD